MAERDVNLEISADETGLVASLRRSEEAVKRSTAEMKASFDRFGQGLQAIQKTFLAFSAVLMGGEAIKSIIKSAGDWQLEAVKLSKALGVSTEQASVYQVALHHIGVESDLMIAAAARMSKQIYTNGDAFEKLGVQTRDSQGHFRPLVDVMGEVNAKLLEIKNPIEQNIAGMQVYGKAWSEVRVLLKLNAEVMQHAEERATALGLKVGPEGAAMAKSYKESLADVELVGKSLTTQLGNQLLPIFTQLGSAMSDEAPRASEIFGTALKYIAEAANLVWHALEMIGTAIGGLAAAGAAVLTGDFSQAKQIWNMTGDELDAIGAKADAFWEKLNKPIAPSKTPEINSGPAPFEDKDAGKSRAGEWETQLAEQKAAYQEQQREAGSFHEFSQAQELAYWQNILTTTKTSLEERRAVRGKIAAAELAIDKQKFEGEVGALKAQEAQYKANADAKLLIAKQAAEKMKTAYGEDSRQYQEAARHVVEIEREKQQQLVQIEQLRVDLVQQRAAANVEADEEIAREQVALGLLTHLQLAQQELQFEERRVQIQRAALEQRKALIDPQHDPIAFAALNAQIEQLEIQHNRKMNQIKAQVALQARAPAIAMINSIEQQWQGGLSRMLQGQLRFRDAIRGAWQSIGAAMAESMAKSVLENAKGLAIQALTGKKAVLNDAYQAASGAYKAVVGIPYVGPFLAPAAAAAAFAATAAFGGNISAAGGYDIPRGINPMTQLHEREMVLPAKHADVIRGLADGGGSGGSSPSFAIHLNAIDARSGADFLRKNSAQIVKQLHREWNRFNRPGAGR